MIEKTVKKFVEYQLRTGLISKEDIRIYSYGYTLVLEMLINMFISIIIGYFFHELPAVLFFLLCFIPLRSYCGGYHASKAWKCIILSNAVTFCVTFVIKYMCFRFSEIELLLFEIILIAFIIKLSPVQCSDKKLTDKEKYIYKKYVRVILIVELILGIILFRFEWEKFGFVMILSHIVLMFALILARCDSTYES